jgi:predicted glycoside hydrolase/deacetylase ChbG (UPF0249 family)
MSRLLVVTADDLGLTDGVCRAVHRAHVDGIVTATSLLAVGRAFETAAAMLRETPTLDLGAHLALVGEDPPLLTASEVPTLVDARGAFPLSYRTVVERGLAGRIDPDDVRRELSAQLGRVMGIGLPVSHLDTHQHTHLWPLVARVVTELAVEHEIPAVRLPVSHSRGVVGAGVGFLAARLKRCIRAAGRVATADYDGLDPAGGLDLPAFERSLTHLARRARPTAEINCHPGEAGDDDLCRFSWGYRWSDELAMVTDERARALVEQLGYRLGSFRDIQDAGRDGVAGGLDRM